MRRTAILLAVIAALSGCGVTAPLKPRAGHELPEAPIGRDTRPGADELLRSPSQAAPERSVELRKRSQDREDDPYDLPPES